ncbi:MAG TPA: alginate lyase family protein, partial [Acidimicrobiales bacterium]|nr:alginate lyase family protein [Acidimicrobiales bacterium]
SDHRPPPAALDADLAGVPRASVDELVAAAAALVDGRGELLGVEREDLADPDWFFDPSSGGRFERDVSAFRVDYRGAGDTRSVKHVWELSRHQQLTVLACAWRVTGDGAYAQLCKRQLEDWCEENPVLVGVNWSSGIELALRLISWVWARRLLDGWPGAPAAFEENETFLRQVYWHQRYLAAFPSRGSSANNHVVAEAAGQLAASCAFGWFDESDRWRRSSAALFETELARNTFPSGMNREQAFDYHGFVAELGLVAAAEAEAAGHPVSADLWRRLCAMVDVVAATLDRTGRAPRFGDADDGRGVLLGAPGWDRWRSLLATGNALFGPAPWWPEAPADLQSTLLSGLVGHKIAVPDRPEKRPDRFADSGLTILRTDARDPSPEIWCRCDGGSHGFLSIAAHAHADALSLEVRVDGVDILADPGTYCYQGSPAWRRYFRSTLAHNTLELAGSDQSVSAGPFLWTHHARTRVVRVATEGGPVKHWCAEHDGYARLHPPAVHRRSVTLDPADRTVEIVDEVLGDGAHPVRLAFHLGPAVEAACDGRRAALSWNGAGGTPASGVLELATALSWRADRGATDPPLGWYSPGFGRKTPATVLVGSGTSADGPFRTLLRLPAPPAGDVQAAGSSPTVAVAGTASTAIATARSSK